MDQPERTYEDMTSNHRRDTRYHLSSHHRMLAAAVVAGALASGLGAGPAFAVPEQGGAAPSVPESPEQGGTAPSTPAVPEQGGTTPAPSPVPPVTYSPGPGTLPPPPQEAPYQQLVTPQYDDTYTPVPTAPLGPPRPVAPVRPIAPPPEKIRIGNYVTDIPKGMSRRDVTSVNEWAAYTEAKIAQGLISVGVPADEASRQAAATVIGVAAGGATGAAAAGIPAAVVGGVGGAVSGGVVGGVTSAGNPLNVAGGAGIGAAAGAAALGIPAAIVGGAAGGLAGGVIAHTLGAGDPGANPRLPGQPDRPHTAPTPTEPPANPGANQFELNLPADKAAKVGLPAVDYKVTAGGDVNASATVGGQTLHAGWSKEQARAPYAALGAAAPQVEKHVHEATKQAVSGLNKAIPGLHVEWPQQKKPASRR